MNRVDLLVEQIERGHEALDRVVGNVAEANVRIARVRQIGGQEVGDFFIAADRELSHEHSLAEAPFSDGESA